MASTTKHVYQPRTILGSLVTTFTPPASCAYIAVPASTWEWDGAFGWRGQSCDASSYNGFLDATECWPVTTAGAALPSQAFKGWGFYSPGLVCPSGYTSACTATASGDAGWPVQFEMIAGETAVGCCPIGYSCTYVSNSGVSCAFKTTSAVVTVATCSADGDMVPSVITYPHVTVSAIATMDTSSGLGSSQAPDTATPSTGSTTTTITTTIGSIMALAPMIQINWQATDLASAATKPPTTSTNGPTASPTNRSSPATLSTGGIAGIVIGCVVAFLVAGAVAFFVLRRRRQSGKDNSQPSEYGNDNMRYPEQHQHQQLISPSPPQLEAQSQYQDPDNVVEMDGLHRPTELPGTRCVTEMPPEGLPPQLAEVSAVEI